MPLTPIPTYPGQIFHIDKKIWYSQQYAKIKIEKSKAYKVPLREIMIAFGMPKLIVMDNEPNYIWPLETEKAREQVSKYISNKQAEDLTPHNQNRNPIRKYKEGETIYVC